MNNRKDSKLSTILLDTGLYLAAITFIFYVWCFAFEIGYLLFFHIPYSFVAIDVDNVNNIGVALTSVLQTSSLCVLSIVILLRLFRKNKLSNFVIKLAPIVLVFLFFYNGQYKANSYGFAWNSLFSSYVFIPISILYLIPDITYCYKRKLRQNKFMMNLFLISNTRSIKATGTILYLIFVLFVTSHNLMRTGHRIAFEKVYYTVIFDKQTNARYAAVLNHSEEFVCVKLNNGNTFHKFYVLHHLELNIDRYSLSIDSLGTLKYDKLLSE